MTNFEQDILDSHNKYRANHQAPPLIWNTRLANEAQEWAERLARENRLKHADTEDGENIYMAFGKDVDGEEATFKWYEEIKNYSFGRPGFQSNTGHFTQVVWKGSRELGAGMAVGHDGKAFVVARYRPSGNNLRTFDENVARCKKGSTWDAGQWNSMNYNDREAPNLDQYKRHSGRWDYNTEPMRSRQPPNKRYSNGWQSLSINDDRSWIQNEAPLQSSNQAPVKKMSTKPVTVKKDDHSWIQNKGENTKTSWSEPRTRLSNGYDYVTTSSVKVQESAPSKMFTQTETRKQATDPWSPVAKQKETSARVSNFSEPNKHMSGGWDAVDYNKRQGKPKHEETKRGTGRWDPITDYNQTIPMTKWDSGKWFEPVEDSTESVTQQSAPSRNFEAWNDNYRQEPKPNEKSYKRHSGRWQPGVNDVMFKEPQQERVYSTNEPLKMRDSTGKTKNIADRWEKSSKVKESNDRSLGRNGSMEIDGMRYHGIQSGRGKTKESIRRWEQNAVDQPDSSSQGNKLNKSSQSLPYRSSSISQSNRSNRPSQSNQSYPTNQSNRYSWPNQSNQSVERWDPLWQEDRPYSQNQRPASIEGSKIREQKIQNTLMAEYESSPYREPRERKIVTTIVDGPKKTVVSSLAITLKGNEGRVSGRSKSSEDLRPKSSYSRGSRSTGREAYSSYPYAEARRIDSRSKSSEDLRSRDTTPKHQKSSRAPINEDLFVAEEFKPRQSQPNHDVRSRDTTSKHQKSSRAPINEDLFVAEEFKPRQPNHDTTDGYRAIKPVTKFPSLGQFAQQALDTHNIYRSFHGVQNLMWSAEMADSAQAWAEKLARNRSLKHTTRNGDGENVAMLTGGSKTSKNAAKEAVDTWYNEIKNYNFNRPGYDPKANHFTQVVWKDTKEFGMGCAASSDGSLVVVVARYRPSGNVLRRYELNVFPKVDLIDF